MRKRIDDVERLGHGANRIGSKPPGGSAAAETEQALRAVPQGVMRFEEPAHHRVIVIARSEPIRFTPWPRRPALRRRARRADDADSTGESRREGPTPPRDAGRTGPRGCGGTAHTASLLLVAVSLPDTPPRRALHCGPSRSQRGSRGKPDRLLVPRSPSGPRAAIRMRVRIGRPRLRQSTYAHKSVRKAFQLPGRRDFSCGNWVSGRKINSGEGQTAAASGDPAPNLMCLSLAHNGPGVKRIFFGLDNKWPQTYS